MAQLYVSDPSAKVKRPERELKGFAEVRLIAGETKHVSFTLDARAFSYWDESAHKWTIDPGKFVILVGDSSENTPLHADVTLNQRDRKQGKKNPAGVLTEATKEGLHRIWRPSFVALH